MEYQDTNTYSIYLGSSREQHKYIVSQSQGVLKLGRILMKSGASAYRIKASMARLAKAVGLQEHHAQVTFTEIATDAAALHTHQVQWSLDQARDFQDWLRTKPGKENEVIDGRWPIRR